MKQRSRLELTVDSGIKRRLEQERLQVSERLDRHVSMNELVTQIIAAYLDDLISFKEDV